jgi:hypothetical protein
MSPDGPAQRSKGANMVEIEMGNVLPGHVVYLPGDMLGKVTHLELVGTSGHMAIHTDLGSVWGAMSDMVRIDRIGR